MIDNRWLHLLADERSIPPIVRRLTPDLRARSCCDKPMAFLNCLTFLPSTVPGIMLAVYCSKHCGVNRFVLRAMLTGLLNNAKLPNMASIQNKRPGLAGALIKARRAQGFTQYELASRSGVSRPTIANIERGTHTEIQMSTAEDLARALSIPVSQLSTKVCDTLSPSQMVEEFMESDWAKVTEPTEEEIDWLRSLPKIKWLGERPTPKTFHLLIEALRESKKQQR